MASDDEPDLLPPKKKAHTQNTTLRTEINGEEHEFEKHYHCSKRYLYTFRHWTKQFEGQKYQLLYRCSRRRTGCNATAILTYIPAHHDFGCEKFGGSLHTCGAPLGQICDHSIIELLKNRALALQLSCPYLPPMQIARQILFDANSEKGFEFQWSLSVQALRNFLVVNKRESVSHWLSRVTCPPISLVSDTDLRSFLQFALICNIKNKPSTIIGWGHPHFLLMARSGKLHYFIDGTFKCVPRDFKQLITILCFDERTKLFLPMFLVLAQSKDAEVYTNVLTLCQQACGFTMDPKSFTSDFEPGIYNSVKRHFPDTNVVGCLFHFVQALGRRLSKVHHIPIPIIHLLVAEPVGLCRLLTVIPIVDIETKGIPYIRAKLAECIDISGNLYTA